MRLWGAIIRAQVRIHCLIPNVITTNVHECNCRIWNEAMVWFRVELRSGNGTAGD